MLSAREVQQNSDDKTTEEQGRQQIPEMEKQRRQAVSNCRYQVSELLKSEFEIRIIKKSEF